MKVERLDKTGERDWMVRMTVVDLAGREQEGAASLAAGPEANRSVLREQAFINKSLFHLTTVIQTLSSTQKKKLVPFRNSKLTLVLSDSLQGNSRTAAITTLSPSRNAFDENYCTLRFGCMLKNIRTVATVKSDRKAEVKALLESEILKLRGQLQERTVQQVQEKFLHANQREEWLKETRALTKKLRETEGLAMEYKQSWEEQQRKTDVGRRGRTKTLDRLGLTPRVSNSCPYPEPDS